MKKKVTIIDYNAGNIRSIVNMLNYLGGECEIVKTGSELKNAQRVIFPGQGHFARAMENLQERDFANAIKEKIAQDAPFLGICVGMQILFDSSEEAPGAEGLSILKGCVKKFTKGKTPQIGWNKVQTTKNNTYLSDDYFYFVNSYYVEPSDKNIVSATTTYYSKFCSAVQKDNITAVQFHPEKSSAAGCEFFDNWLNKT